MFPLGMFTHTLLTLLGTNTLAGTPHFVKYAEPQSGSDCYAAPTIAANIIIYVEILNSSHFKIICLTFKWNSNLKLNITSGNYISQFVLKMEDKYNYAKLYLKPGFTFE